MVNLDSSAGGWFSRTFTPGTIIAIVVPLITMIVFFVRLDASNTQQDKDIADLLMNFKTFQSSVITKSEADQNRRSRDQEIGELRNLFNQNRADITSTFAGFTSRIDRLSERIDIISEKATRLDATISFLQRQARNGASRDFDGSPLSIGPR